MFAEPPREAVPVPAQSKQPPQGSVGNEPRRVLVVEDDEMLSRFLERLLRSEGFEVEVVCDGEGALSRLGPEYALLILDLKLPTLDGIAVLQKLRPGFPQLPVLVLTGRSKTDSTVLALESGADDCLNKPFSYLELMARVRALLRRSTPMPAADSSQCGDLLLHRGERRVVRGGQRIELTPREYSLLEFLMRTPRVPVPRAVLLQEVWGSECESSTNIVDVYMKYVRDKVDRSGQPKLIRTVRGLGYVVSED